MLFYIDLVRSAASGQLRTSLTAILDTGYSPITDQLDDVQQHWTWQTTRSSEPLAVGQIAISGLE